MSSYYCILATFIISTSAQLPTLYEYYTTDGISSGLSVDQPYFTLNDKNITIYSGAMHYFRIPSQHWQDRLKKLRAAGLNAVETYIPWNLHEPKSGVFEFGNAGSDMQSFADLQGFLTLAQQEDLFVILRPGPYICSEWEWGGFPSWLLREERIRVRTSEPVYMSYVTRYFNELLGILAPFQFTEGGPIIAFQVENEYGFSSEIDLDYIQQLVDLIKSNNIKELLFTADGAGSRTSGTLPGVLFQTVNFGSDPDASFSILEEIQPGKPLMVMEFYPGWADHWAETHHTQDNDTFRTNYEATISYPASANLYMFLGGTNWGFLNGANIGPGDNSGYQPMTTSYDFDAPLTEAGDYTGKYYIIRELIQKYNPIQTLTPNPPISLEREVYPTIPIDSEMSFNDIIVNANNIIVSSVPISMENLPINDQNGQSYGYIVYRKEDLNIPANSILTITGHIHDTVMILIDGNLVSDRLTSSDDFNKFGYWRLENSSITLTTSDLTGATLDIVIENWGRAHFGNLYHQVKGLVDDNHVYLNDEKLTFWSIYPLEFQKSWTNGLTDWTPVTGEELQKGPGLYKATLSFDDFREYNDTFIDMRDWKKGIVIFNGFVLGRYTFIGPQQTLYLPGPYIQQGDNEIVIFEHFEPGTEIKFSKDSIFSTL